MEETLGNYTHRHSERVREKSGSKTYSDKLQLFITLHWLRQYPTTRSLSATYGIHYETIQHFYERCVGAIANKLGDEIPFFDSQELETEAKKWQEPLGEDFAGVVAKHVDTESSFPLHPS